MIVTSNTPSTNVVPAAPALPQDPAYAPLVAANPKLLELIAKHPGVASFLAVNKAAIHQPTPAQVVSKSSVTWHIYGHGTLSDAQQLEDVVFVIAQGAAYSGSSVTFGGRVYQNTALIFVGQEGQFPLRARYPDSDVGGTYSDTPMSFPVYGAAKLMYVRDPLDAQGNIKTAGGWPEGYTGRNAQIPQAPGSYEIYIPPMGQPSPVTLTGPAK